MFFASAFLLMWTKSVPFGVLAKMLALQGHGISNSFCMKLKQFLAPMDILCIILILPTVKGRPLKLPCVILITILLDSLLVKCPEQ